MKTNWVFLVPLWRIEEKKSFLLLWADLIFEIFLVVMLPSCIPFKAYFTSHWTRTRSFCAFWRSVVQETGNSKTNEVLGTWNWTAFLRSPVEDAVLRLWFTLVKQPWCKKVNSKAVSTSAARELAPVDGQDRGRLFLFFFKHAYAYVVDLRGWMDTHETQQKRIAFESCSWARARGHWTYVISPSLANIPC